MKLVVFVTRRLAFSSFYYIITWVELYTRIFFMAVQRNVRRHLLRALPFGADRVSSKHREPAAGAIKGQMGPSTCNVACRIAQCGHHRWRPNICLLLRHHKHYRSGNDQRDEASIWAEHLCARALWRLVPAAQTQARGGHCFRSPGSIRRATSHSRWWFRYYLQWSAERVCQRERLLRRPGATRRDSS